MKQIDITRFEPLDYAVGEAVNTLCTNLSFTGRDKKVIMVTSCIAAEGKSFLSMNIMRTMAQFSKSVVLVDADLRRSVLTNSFGLQIPGERAGLAHFLAGMTSMDDVMYATSIPNAFMVPVGRVVSNSLALLSTPLLGQLLNRLAKGFDLVLVDSPPIGIIIDAAEIAKFCHGAVITVSYNQVRRRELIEARQQIELAGTPVLGAILNNVELDSFMGRRYYYRYSGYQKQYLKEVPPEKVSRKQRRAADKHRSA